MDELMEEVRQAAEQFQDRYNTDKRDAFYEAVRAAAVRHSLTDIATLSGRSPERIRQIVGNRPHHDGRRGRMGSPT